MKGNILDKIEAAIRIYSVAGYQNKVLNVNDTHFSSIQKTLHVICMYQ